MDKSQPNLPRHVAIIMDGNGRWAKQHRLSVALGHRRGVEALRGVIRASSDRGIEVLSLFAFSTENWKRSPAEVAALMRLILEFFVSEIDELDQNKVRVRIIGDKALLPPAQREAVTAAQVRTAQNGGLQLNIALNYGGRADIIQAARILAGRVAQGQLAVEQIDEAALAGALYTAGQPDVDLLIRTSGEQRLSNFMLYQCAYAELMFPDMLWPDFTVADYQDCLERFVARERRFGGRTP